LRGVHRVTLSTEAVDYRLRAKGRSGARAAARRASICSR
jgi:hypothetical protein